MFKGCQIFGGEPQTSADLATPPLTYLMEQTVDGVGGGASSGVRQIQLIKYNRATGQTKHELRSN